MDLNDLEFSGTHIHIDSNLSDKMNMIISSIYKKISENVSEAEQMVNRYRHRSVTAVRTFK